ncbi:hypothetical protein [Priestia megaterium]
MVYSKEEVEAVLAKARAMNKRISGKRKPLSVPSLHNEPRKILEQANAVLAKARAINSNASIKSHNDSEYVICEEPKLPFEIINNEKKKASGPELKIIQNRDGKKFNPGPKQLPATEVYMTPVEKFKKVSTPEIYMAPVEEFKKTLDSAGFYITQNLEFRKALDKLDHKALDRVIEELNLVCDQKTKFKKLY